MAILYSRLATSLRSPAIFLLIHLPLLSLASTFATISYNYNTYAYEAERRRTCPYTIIAFSVNRYVSLTGFREFTPFRRATSYSHHLRLLPSKRDIEAWLLRARILIVSLFNWATSWHPGWVQRLIGAQDASPAAKTIIVTSTTHGYSTLPPREIEYDRHISVRTQFLRVNWSRSSVGEPTIKGAILPLHCQYRKPKAKSWDDCESAELRLHSF